MGSKTFVESQGSRILIVIPARIIHCLDNWRNQVNSSYHGDMKYAGVTTEWVKLKYTKEKVQMNIKTLRKPVKRLPEKFKDNAGASPKVDIVPKLFKVSHSIEHAM